MKLVTFNIQYGFGLDEKCDPERIAKAVSSADIIALQEVSDNLPTNGHLDLPAILSDCLPQHFFAFGPGADADGGSEIVNGRAVMSRIRFGNMILTRYPILATRNLLLPRTRTYDMMNLQRCALEALIAAPSGPIRIYSIHLDHRDPCERMRQIEFLMDHAIHYGTKGGAVTGGKVFGFPDLPHTDDFIIMGDFNMQPEGLEYRTIAGEIDIYYGRTIRSNYLTDALAYLGKNTEKSYTWEETGHPEIRQYLDYCFASASIAPRLKDGWIDEECIASDHKPVWLELG